MLTTYSATGRPAGRVYAGKVNGKWDYIDTLGRTFDQEKVEEFKTHFYKLQGWDVTSGYPTRRTLVSLGLAHVADELEKAGKLGVGDFVNGATAVEQGVATPCFGE